MAEKNKTGSAGMGCLALIVIVFVLWAFHALFGSSDKGSGGGNKPSGGEKKAAYTTEVVDHIVINPADLAVTAHVTNSGKAAGKPQCTIKASDPTGTYSGVDVATLQDPVAVGATTTFVDHVTVTKQGAQYVTEVKVSCS